MQPDHDAREEAIRRAMAARDAVAAACAGYLDERLARLRETAAAGDVDAFTRTAHDLAGEAAVFGAEAATVLAREARAIAEAPPGPKQTDAMIVAAEAITMAANARMTAEDPEARKLRDQLQAVAATIGAAPGS